MLIGRRVSGRYKVIRLIGGGGMANVYLAHDMILDRDVAIKILRLDFATEDEFIRRFQREAQSATSLTHENIVSIYDVGEEDDIYYIVMEFVDGMTLKEYIQSYHPLEIEKTIDIMKQLTSAVAHAHQNHIIHRDIKPQNILIDHDGHVMITDFGIAMALSATSITQTNAVLGSVHYLSPEQARGGMATKKSDIYSLGIVMFELLTGRLPFFGESAISIALKHLQSDTPSPRRWNPMVPQSLENIVLKATTKDPFQRYDSAEEMESDLDTALDPARKNEPKFAIPEDHEATKAIPIITEDDLTNMNNKTIPHPKNGQAKGDTKNATKPSPKKKKRKKWPWVVGSISALLILLLVFLMFILPAIHAAQTIEVPDLRGEEYDDAVAMLVDNGLEIGDTIEMPSEEVDEGKVIKTDPRAGKSIKKGQIVKIYLSTGKEKVTLSDYTGQSFEDVKELLEKLGFNVDDIQKEEVYNDASAGTIIEQTPDPETEVIPDEVTLKFVVSMGQELLTLKDLTGYNRKGLENYEESTGLDIDMSAEEYSDTVPEGIVISQEPESGTELSKGEKVKVIISKGQEEIPFKEVTKEITIPYDPSANEEENMDEEEVGEEGQEEGEQEQEEKKENPPQEIKILIQDMDNNMSVPADTFTITETSVREVKFRIEKGSSASYKVMRGNTVIKEEDVPYPGD
ncbi:serine/threonine protein kinase [Virgibacillus soli]|uniref:Stk1 family PASTA domain-containing Ser/Thr kinase n=1 Tax=Lederbergia galactosidilytica TaxID=217031 RepID=UPI0007129066|nr:Stk1 family PASTA domain-containing Ser/Thr kinase [Lederbergia galactosidilytica]KRG13518.1 serine/threonine protein kinase [Virgibacillus soli]MBP1913700.1 serine/threonine-protein kinase [Lederbergia galactosidilytica]